MISTQRFHHAVTSALVAFLLTLGGGWSAPSRAADDVSAVDLSKTPPDLTTSVDPNIVLSFDDSGSMLATAMPDSISDPSDFDEEYYYSSTTNVIYYDPGKVYVPPSKPDGSPFPNSSYSNAWRDGLCANWPVSYCDDAHYRDLSSEFDQDFANKTSTSSTANSNNTTQNWIPNSIIEASYHGGFYYDCPTVESNAGCTKVEMNSATAAQKQNFANWYSYYRTRNLMTRTSVSRAFAQMGDSIRVAWQTINDIPLTDSDEIKPLAGTTTGSWRHKFFTFLYNVHTAGSTPDRNATNRVGEFFERDPTGDNYKNPYWSGLPDDTSTSNDESILSCRQNFHMLVTDGYWNNDNESLIPNMQTAQETVTLPDNTQYTANADESKIIWNVDDPEGDEKSLANIAFNYWATDLQPDLGNDVPAFVPDLSTGVTGTVDYVPGPGVDPLDNAEIYWNPKNDPATWQHVVQFMVTLGVAGELTWPDDYADLRTGDMEWPDPQNNSPSAVDDTWHAAVVSRGQYFSASDPNTLVSSLTAILNSVIARKSSSTAGSLNTGVVTTNTNSFFSGYDSTDWHGSLTAREVNLNGGIGEILWDAGCILTGGFCAITGEDVGAAVDPVTRKIFTSTAIGNDNGATFTWVNISDAQRALLRTNPVDGTLDTVAVGKLRLKFLRGDRSQESVSPGFHRRGSVLGAAINSQPNFVSYPSGGYRDDYPAGSPEATAAALGQTYEKFAFDHKDRAPTVYVGANDGMLHAFNAETGAERFAYVPAAVYPRLSSLTAVDYVYTPTVDNSAVTKDVFIDAGDGTAAWHTILVGSLRYGGRGVFALDITDPTTFGTDDVLWEFTFESPGGDNLGYTYGTPVIGRLGTGKWVVLVPGGYFPEDNNDPNYGLDPDAARKTSSLFVLNAETGALIKELKTPTSVNSWGLSSPVLGDYESDQIADVAFAGDIVGNLWRFDLSGDESTWSVDQVFEPPIDLEQPITVKPRLFPDPITKGLIVVFGTGKYLGLDDRTNTGPVQAVYGIRDKGPGAPEYPLQQSDLVPQTMTEASGVRLLTGEPVPATKEGWYFNLYAPGERVVVQATALFNTNRAVIATLIPTGSDPCNPGREGAILVVDAVTGGPGGGLDALGSSGLPVPEGGGIAGALVDNPPATGVLPTATVVGGGQVLIPGITLPNGQTFGLGDSFWRRRSWRVLK